MPFEFNHSFLPKEFDRFFIGLDPFVKKISEAAEQSVKLAQNYPPYNIKKIDENRYIIEMAVAGFGKQDIELELVDDKLTIKGNTQADSNNSIVETLYQGLAMRPFTRQFTLADNVEIRGAKLLNGVLRIGLEAIIPEHKKPKKIHIDDTEETTSHHSTAEFLAEKKEK